MKDENSAHGYTEGSEGPSIKVRGRNTFDIMKDNIRHPGYQRRITLASNVIMFLAQYIHGIECGKLDEKILMDLRNANDQFQALLKEEIL